MGATVAASTERPSASSRATHFLRIGCEPGVRRRRLRVAVAGRTVERLSTPSRAKGEAGLAAYHGVRQRADSVRLRLGLKRMLRLWIGEESGAKRGSRVVGTSQSGRFLDPSDSATGYPATFSMHLVGLDGAGSWFKVFRSYHSVAPD